MTEKTREAWETELLTHEPSGKPQVWFTRKEVVSIISAATARAMAEAVRAPDAVAALADAFERSADWLDKGVLHGPKRTHPLVGTADYRKAAALLRSMKKEGKP